MEEGMFYQSTEGSVQYLFFKESEINRRSTVKI